MDHHELLVRASRLYFEAGETQERVAEMLGVHRSQVSRLLKEARATGIVQITVNDGRADGRHLGADLQRRFGVRDAHLVRRLGTAEEHTRRLVGMEAARLIRDVVRPGMLVGLGGGATTAAVVDALEQAPASASVTTVPLMGGLGPYPGTMQQARRMADALGGLAVELPAPGVVRDRTVRDALLRHAIVEQVVRAWSRLDVAIVGVGAPEWSPSWYGPELPERLERVGAIGEVLAWPYDAAGNPAAPELADLMIAFAPERLVEVPLAITVTCGDTKVLPLLGALRAGFVHTLVSDVETVAQVLRMDLQQARPTGTGTATPEMRTEIGT